MEHLAIALDVPLGVLLERSGWTGSGTFQAATAAHTASTAELQASIDELQANNDHLRASLLDLLRENAALLGLTTDRDPPELEEVTRRHLGSVLNSLDDAAAVVDAHGTVILRNDAFVSLFAGDPAMVDTAGEPVPHEATPLQRAARRERFSVAFGLDRFGSTSWYWVEGKPMADDHGVPLGVLTIRRITPPR
jgi:PAS domain-containing protein